MHHERQLVVMADTTHEEDLRQWAKGSYPQEAGTELLLRAFGGRFAGRGQPWIYPRTSDGSYIDFAAIPEHAKSGVYSSGERRFLLLAASFGGGGEPIDLADILSGLDREIVVLALAAVSHATGSHEGTGIIYNEDDTPKAFTRLTSLYPWPPREQATTETPSNLG